MVGFDFAPVGGLSEGQPLHKKRRTGYTDFEGCGKVSKQTSRFVMAKFYDKAMRYADSWEPELRVHMTAPDLEIIDGTNLSDFFFQNDEKGDFNLIEDFPNIAPVFPRFWIECRAPKQVLSPEGVKPYPLNDCPPEWGVLFIGTEIASLTDNERHLIPTAITPGARWVLQGILFSTGYFDTKIQPRFAWWMPVLADGTQPIRETPIDRQIKVIVYESPQAEVKVNYQPDPARPGFGQIELTDELIEAGMVELKAFDGGVWSRGRTLVPYPVQYRTTLWRIQTTRAYFQVTALGLPANKQKRPQAVAAVVNAEEEYWLNFFPVCLMALCFLHCKGVTVETVKPPIALSKKHTKRYGRPLCTHGVLKIQPMRKVLETEGGANQTGLKRSLHVCRGHFSDYRVNPLFGKYKGIYWVPAHLRGSIERGFHTKEYAVESPKQKAS